MTNHEADGGIPLLTEVLPVADQYAQDDAALLVSPVLLLEVSIPELTIPSQSDDRHALYWSEQELIRMQAEISERITRQVLRRIDGMLEQRVRDSLADVMQLAVSGLAQGIRNDLKQTLEEAVQRAVAQEMSHFQSKNISL